MTNTIPTQAEPKDGLERPVNNSKLDTKHLQEAENEGLAPIVPANPAVRHEQNPLR